MKAQVELLEATCACLKVPNGCDARLCADRARKAFGETPRGWGNTAEADTWSANERLIDKCMSDIIDGTGHWNDAEELKRLRYQNYDKRIDTGCKP
jgi:hypothetical protein